MMPCHMTAKLPLATHCRWLLTLLLCLATPLATADTISDAARLTARGWAPFMLLYHSAGSQDALKQAQHILRINQASLKKPQIDPELEALTKQIIEQLGNFELDGLYELLPSTDGKRHLLIINSRPTEGGFRVSRGNLPLDQQALSKMSATRGIVSLHPASAADGYHVSMAMQGNIGEVTWRDMQKSSRATLRHLAQAAALTPPASAKQGTQSWFAAASADEQAVLSQLWSAFPATFSWLDRFSRLKDFYGEPASIEGVRHLHMILQLDMEALKAAYPTVAAYMEKMRGFLVGKAEINGVGGNWLTASVDTNSMTVELGFWTKDGYPLPSVNGKPNLHFPYANLPDRFPFYSQLNLHFQSLGVTVDITDLETDWNFRHQGAQTRLIGRMDTQPKVAVSGWALGFMPTVLLKLSPIDIESTVNHFMNIFMNSNQGKGAHLQLVLNESSGRDSLAKGQAKGDVANSFFVSLMMRMFNERMVPSPEQTEALRQLARGLSTAVSSDLARFSEFLEAHPSLASYWQSDAAPASSSKL